MKISLDLLHILDAIERHGSFSAAAAVLHRVPSALSHAVAKLEDELDIQLFVREGRKATLNEAGRATPSATLSSGSVSLLQWRNRSCTSRMKAWKCTRRLRW